MMQSYVFDLLPKQTSPETEL